MTSNEASGGNLIDVSSMTETALKPGKLPLDPVSESDRPFVA